MPAPQIPAPAPENPWEGYAHIRDEALGPDLDWENGRFGRYDWKGAVGENVRRLWATFSDEQKAAIAIDAERAANAHDYPD